MNSMRIKISELNLVSILLISITSTEGSYPYKSEATACLSKEILH